MLYGMAEKNHLCTVRYKHGDSLQYASVILSSKVELDTSVYSGITTSNNSKS